MRGGRAVPHVAAIGPSAASSGTLAPGRAAGLIALSGNLFGLPAEQIKDCRVELTMVEGQIHHRLW